MSSHKKRRCRAHRTAGSVDVSWVNGKAGLKEENTLTPADAICNGENICVQREWSLRKQSGRGVGKVGVTDNSRANGFWSCEFTLE